MSPWKWLQEVLIVAVVQRWCAPDDQVLYIDDDGNRTAVATLAQECAFDLIEHHLEVEYGHEPH